MTSIIRDLLGHQAWADAEHWRAVGSHCAARDDKTIRDRLHHIHLVQRNFAWTVGERSAPFTLSRPDEFPSFDDLQAYGRETHRRIERLLSSLTDASLAERIRIPWFGEPSLTITAGEALAQCAMHSQWHRGQNATRLRELGAVPPTLDLIVWYWKGRPAAAWT